MREMLQFLRAKEMEQGNLTLMLTFLSMMMVLTICSYVSYSDMSNGDWILKYKNK